MALNAEFLNKGANRIRFMELKRVYSSKSLLDLVTAYREIDQDANIRENAPIYLEAVICALRDKYHVTQEQLREMLK